MRAREAVEQAWPEDGTFRVFKTAHCGFCTAAINLLTQKGQAFETYDLTGEDEARAALVSRTGMRTVPQIWHGGTFVGGYQELVPYLKERGL